MLIDTSLAPLPLARPEPGLIGWHWDLRTQLDDSVISLDDLDLSAGSVEMMTSPEIRGKHDLAPSAHTYK